jgi:NADPH:quinone reductase-like Zn-dependent oxidoreductase
MKAAVVHAFDQPPRYDDFADPVAAADETLVRVTAASLNQLTRARAAGRHYSSAKALNVVPGIDGVGRLPDGQRVYFLFPSAPHGSMAELTRVLKTQIVTIPDDVDDVLLAALANPAMSSWAALAERAQLRRGESVLVNGATGVSGRLAVQIARYLGAGKVIATGRNRASLEALPELGADVVISLEQSAAALAKLFQHEMAEVDIVLDYLWGQPAELLLSAIAAQGQHDPSPRLRFVQIGSIAGPTVALPAATLRSTGLELLGSGLGSLPQRALLSAVAGVAQALLSGRLIMEHRRIPLREVEQSWNLPTADRIVYTP